MSTIDANVSSVGPDSVVLTCYPAGGDPISIEVPLIRMPPGLAVFGAGVLLSADADDPSGYAIGERTMAPVHDQDISELEAWLASLSD